jgi:hypothetical protein
MVDWPGLCVNSRVKGNQIKVSDSGTYCFSEFERDFVNLKCAVMIFKQKLSILVLPKWKKTDSEGLTPIYLRITIDGLPEYNWNRSGTRNVQLKWIMGGLKVLWSRG